MMDDTESGERARCAGLRTGVGARLCASGLWGRLCTLHTLLLRNRLFVSHIFNYNKRQLLDVLEF
jgi:hypothetical protein